jgi:hypothetical protein
MVIVEFLLLSLVGGALLGVGWRLTEDYLEKRGNKSE